MSKKLYSLISFPVTTHACSYTHTHSYISITSENTNGNVTVIFQAFSFFFIEGGKEERRKKMRTIRSKDPMQLRRHDAVQQRQVRPLRVHLHDLVVRAAHGLRQHAVRMRHQRPDQLIQHVIQLELQSVHELPKEVHEVHELRGVEADEQVTH